MPDLRKSFAVFAVILAALFTGCSSESGNGEHHDGGRLEGARGEHGGEHGREGRGEHGGEHGGEGRGEHR